MALMMTLMPIGNVLPEVSVYAADQGSIVVTVGSYVDISSVKVQRTHDASGNSLGTPEAERTDGVSDAVAKTVTFSNLVWGSYRITGSSTNALFSVSEKTDIGVTDDSSPSSATLTATLSSEQTFNVSISSATNISVTPNTITYAPNASDASKGTGTIPANTSADKKVIVTFQLPADKKITTTTDTDANPKITYDSTTKKYTYEITVGALLDTNIGNPKIEPTVDSIAVNTPDGTWAIISTPDGNGFYKKTSRATVTFTPAADNFLEDYELQYAIKNANSSDPTEAEWKPASISNDRFTFDVSGNDTDTQRYVAIRYKLGNTYSSVKWLDNPIKFDIAPPTLGVLSRVLNSTYIDDCYWVNNANKDNCKIIYNVSDVESGINSATYIAYDASGVVVTHNSGETSIYNSANNTIEIPVKAGDAKIVVTLKDKVGNDTTKTINIQKSTATLGTATNDTKYIKIAFDLTAPNVAVTYTDESDTSINIEQWQVSNVKVNIQVTDGQAGANEEKIEELEPLTVIVNGMSVHPTVVSPGNYYVVVNQKSDIVIAAKDKIGNTSTDYTKSIKIDKAGISDSQLLFNDSADASVFSTPFEVKATATTISGLQSVTFVFHDNLTNQDKTVTVPATSDGQTELSCAFPAEQFGEEFDGYIQAIYQDYTGKTELNHQITGSQRTVKYNKNGASINLGANQAWTNQNAQVVVSAEDKITGIQKVAYIVNGNRWEIPLSGNPQQYSDTIEVKDSSLSVDGALVVVEITSGAGVTTSNSIRVYIDKQSPTVTLGGVTEGTTYNSARSLQITTNDNIWQKLQPVSVTATKTIDGNTTNIDLGSYTVDSANHVMSKAFSEDGIYNVTVKAVDAAGNSDTKTISFTVDRTAPVISMSGVKEGAYSSNPVTVTFQSVESFFDTNNVKITVERKIEGSTYERTLTFNNTGKTSNLANTFTEDGDYTITMTAIDRAGNEATPQTLSFTVDCTAPSVTLTGTKDYFVTNQPVTLDFLVKEAYFETNQVQIRGSRRLTNGKTEAINISGWSNTGISSSLSNEFTEDGYYTITISATDKAGNNKQQTIHFTIDTEAPVIGDLSQYDGKYLSSFELKESLEDLISELSVPTVKMTLNGEAYDGHEITEDGKYTLVIEVVDEVGLSSTKSVEFVIDKTAPKIIFAGVEDKKTYTEAVRLNLSLENENDTIVEILINGEPYELTEGQSSYDISFDTFGDYEVVVLTIDEAGNDNSQTIQFTYAEHKNMAFLWIVIGAVVVAAGLVIFLVVKSKKKQ